MSTADAPRWLLLADRERALRRFLADNLAADGYAVSDAATTRHLELKLADRPPDLLILGELDGPHTATLVADIRAREAERPQQASIAVLSLGPAGDELAELRALRAGADDHLRKPISYPRLPARVQALLRRQSGSRDRTRIRIGRLELDGLSRHVTARGSAVALSRTEFALLWRLACEPTRVLTKAELLHDVWGHTSARGSRTLDTHACRLRHKLAHAGLPHHVVCVWGIGYRLLDIVDSGTANGSAA